jgi:hypothetical protein
MSEVEYDYLNEKEVLNEAKTYCFMRDTLYLYRGLTSGRKSKDPMPKAILKSLNLEEVRTIITVVKSDGSEQTNKKVEWSRRKVI